MIRTAQYLQNIPSTNLLGLIVLAALAALLCSNSLVVDSPYNSVTIEVCVLSLVTHQFIGILRPLDSALLILEEPVDLPLTAVIITCVKSAYQMNVLLCFRLEEKATSQGKCV